MAAQLRLNRSFWALAAGGWQVAVHYRESAEDAIKTVADCTRLACASAAFHADLADEAEVRGLLPRVIAAAEAMGGGYFASRAADIVTLPGLGANAGLLGALALATAMESTTA